MTGREGKGSSSFLFPHGGALGLDQLFEVFGLHDARVRKLKANVKLILAMPRVLVVGDDLRLDSPRGLSGRGGDFDHQNGSSAGVVIHEEVMTAHLELIGLQAGSFEEEDRSDAQSLYSLLENEIAPLYYNRDRKGVPHGWIKVVKEAVKTVTPAFSACRMMKEYTQKMYLPAAGQQASKSDLLEGKEIGETK